MRKSPVPLIVIAGLLALGAAKPADARTREHRAYRGHVARQRIFVPPQTLPTLMSPPPPSFEPLPLVPPPVAHSRLIPLPYPGLLHQQPVTPLPSGFVMTFAKNDAVPTPNSSGPINQPQQVPPRLAACWTVPPDAPSDAQITVRLAFSRLGAIVGQPRITYVEGGNNAAARQALTQSLLSALTACTPLPFTAGLGSAIAGYPFAIRFVVASR